MNESNVYACQDCLAMYLSETDIAIHNKETGHNNTARLKIGATVKLGEKSLLLLEMA